MSSDINNSTKITKKSSTEPVYDTNWCDMPAEVKSKCIGKLEYEDRLSLRCTAKAERSLVDSQKTEFYKVRISGGSACLSFMLHRANDYDFSKKTLFMNEALEFMNYIGKVGIFETIEIIILDSLTNKEQFMADDQLFEAKKIKFVLCGVDNMTAILRKVKNGVESIEMNGERIMDEDELNEILAISQIQNVPYWHVDYIDQADGLHKVAQMWIDTNPKIGSTFQISTVFDGLFEQFSEHFNDRIVSKSGKRVRISTNNPDRHILLERGLDRVISRNFIDRFYRLMVISARMKDSEYDDNCEEWISKMNLDMADYYNWESSDEE